MLTGILGSPFSGLSHIALGAPPAPLAATASSPPVGFVEPRDTAPSGIVEPRDG